MTPLSFPDINVWLALAVSEHEFSLIARRWWENHAGPIAFSRFTQLGFLRLVTHESMMDGKPLTNVQALKAYDRFFDDDRVVFVSEVPEIERNFRKIAAIPSPSTKLWADAWLLAVADVCGGVLVTFDKALGSRGALCLLGNR